VSQENVERARKATANLESLFDAFAEDVVWDTRDYGREMPPEWAPLARGKADVTRSLRSWVGSWEDYRFEVLDITDAGDSVLLEVRETGHGRTSHAPMEHRYYLTCSFSAGHIVAGAAYSSRNVALRAVGLEE
jgi:ketosteroid isomerase-like protein